MTDLSLQKKLAAKVAKSGRSRVKIVSPEAENLKEAITKADVRDLIEDGVIEILPSSGVSRHRARARHAQRKRGRQRGPGRRKGKASARTSPKRTWINKIRLQRRVLKALRNSKKLSVSDYRKLYLKVKGNAFRSKKHLLQYITQNNLLKGGKK